VIIALAVAASLLTAESGIAATTAPAPAATGQQQASAIAILSDADVALYRQIMTLQETANWKRADPLIKKIKNRILMGHVLFQRYMHPTGYRSTYQELANWLEKYADLPGADRVYRLAMHRKPYDVKPPRQPVPLTPQTAATENIVVDAPRQTKEEVKRRRDAQQLLSAIRDYLRRGEPARAEKRLWSASRLNLLTQADFDGQANRIAVAYLTSGNFEKARALAALAAARSRKDVYTADWTAGLAAWRLKHYADAYQSFRALALSQTADDWTKAAGGFWAYRAAVKAREPENALPMLEAAAKLQYTFYGLVAAQELGVEPQFRWTPPLLTASARERLMQNTGVERAIALRQVGETDLADVEMKAAWMRSDHSADDAFLSVAASLNLPATQVALSLRGNVPDDNGSDAGLYPVPEWRPTGGFLLDRALIFAFMRQESLFDPQAESWAGARGVMQLMPATASFIAGDQSLARVNRAKLFDPRFSMELGQKYLLHLMNWSNIKDNLFLLAAAYNGGPGNLGKWLKQADCGDDWLLFIESIPAQETRVYVERVMANYWIYRLRLGESVPSLTAVASGEGPRYLAQEFPLTETASNSGPSAP
jgi:soluble lytic murein transglycosylase-like protein